LVDLLDLKLSPPVEEVAPKAKAWANDGQADEHRQENAYKPTKHVQLQYNRTSGACGVLVRGLWHFFEHRQAF